VEWHTIVNIESWAELQEEVRGRRTKKWVEDENGQAWLAKLPRGWNEPNGRFVEPLIEALTLHLASKIGIRVATGRLAQWTVNRVAVTGFISRRFTNDEVLLVPGSTVIAARHDEYLTALVEVKHAKATEQQLERRVRAMATLSRTLAAIRAFDDSPAIVEEFITHLIFDAWVGNGDRHPDNWGCLIYYTRNHAELAPMYDTAGCLGSEQPDKTLPVGEVAINQYIARCKSGFGDGEANPATSMRDIISELRALPEWQSVALNVLERIHQLLQQLPMILEVDTPLLTPRRRDFVLRVLKKRVTLLE
jgi:hypothetical protein